MKEFYKAPFDFKKLIEKSPLEKVSINQSIENHIKGLLLTGYHSYRFDPEYGCNLKEFDFELVTNVSAWRTLIERNLQQTITKQETRVKNVRVRVKIEEEIYNNRKDSANVSIRKKLSVTVKCVVKKTNNQLVFPEMSIFISPISFT